MSLDFGYWHRNGYKVHYGTSSRNYGNYQYTADVNNNTSCTISGLEEGKTYYIAVTAYNSLFESDYSKELVAPTLFSNGDELAVDFGTNGLWHYGGASWSNLTPWNPDDDLAGWHGGGMAVDFGGDGLWNHDGASWSKKTPWHCDNMGDVDLN